MLLGLAFCYYTGKINQKQVCDLMKPSDIKQLQNACLAISELKSQLIEELPHFAPSIAIL